VTAGAAAFARWLVERARRRPASDGTQQVAVLCDWLLRYGAAQALGLHAAGASVTLYYVDRLGEFGGSAKERERYLREARDAGIETVAVPSRSMSGLVADTRALLRDLRRRKIECVVAQAHYDPRFAAASFRYATALVLHDPRPHSGEVNVLPRRGRVVARLVEATASCVVIHSERLRAQVRPFLRRQQVVVVPHGTTPRTAPLAVAPAAELLVLGRLYPYKGIDTAIEACALLRHERPDVRLTIAGQGPLLDELRRGLPDGVELDDGYVADEDIDGLLGRARLLLLPYKDATQSGVGLLAIGAGVPCVVTAEGALPDLVPPEHEHFVVPSHDPRELAAAISRCLDHDLRDRHAFLDHARRRFAWPVVGHELLVQLERLGLLEAAAERTPVEPARRAELEVTGVA
jgi:glycosyltransferase involved in cell wall biosynthesis